jgi:hypothetical protein
VDGRIRRQGCLILGAIALSLVLAAIVGGEVIRLADFKPSEVGMPGVQRYERTIQVGPGVIVDAVAEVTVRRNGTLKVANLTLRILDDYDDGSVYVGGLLHVEFVDISRDGFKDLVVTGTVATTGEKETDPVSYSAVTEIYVFDPKKEKFELAFRHGPKLD